MSYLNTANMLCCRFVGGKPVKSSDYDALVELATIGAMCNDSSVDFNEVCDACHKDWHRIICA